MEQRSDTEEQNTEEERFEALRQLEDWLETPVIILGILWLVLLVVELIWGLNPVLEALVLFIWAVFVLDFIVRIILAPRKLVFLRNNWLTALSLLVPALRVFRVARAIRLLRLARATRGLRLVRVVSSLNRGMRSLRASMGRRGFGYVIVLTVFITLAGAAGMYAFEGERAGEQAFSSYGESLWWTAMIMTTLGSEFWPKSAEGRILGFLLAVYAFAVFGYVTATLATYFVGQEAQSEASEMASRHSIEALHAEIRALRAELKELTGKEPQQS